MIKEHWLSPLVVSTNFEEKNRAIINPDYRVIIMDDVPAKYMQLINGEYKLPKNVSILPVLLPQFDSIDAYIEGDFEKSHELYDEYLNTSPYVQHCLNTIFTLLFNNIAVFIYVPASEDPIVDCVNVLINYLNNRYGIMACTANQLFPAINVYSLNPVKYATVIDLMYTYNTIPIDEFCFQYPIEYAPLNPNTISRICIEEGHMNEQMIYTDWNGCVDFAIRYVYGLKQSIIQKYTNPNESTKVSIAFAMEDKPI